jgi:hypothetical protein
MHVCFMLLRCDAWPPYAADVAQDEAILARAQAHASGLSSPFCAHVNPGYWQCCCRGLATPPTHETYDTDVDTASSIIS